MQNWSAGKTVAVIAAIVIGLTVVCCGTAWVLKSDLIKEQAGMVGSGIEMGQKMASGQNRLDTLLEERFGADARWQLTQGASEGILLVGLPEGADVDPAAALDGIWADFAEAYADGAPPVTAIAVGTAGARIGGASSLQGEVKGWTDHVASVDELAERTGVDAPPALEFFERVQRLQKRGSGVRVEVR